jgi:hypothetical protein
MCMESRFSRENINKNMALVDWVKKWAVQKEVMPAQISLAWLMAQKPWIVPIPGTTQMAHMLENVGAADVQFTTDELTKFSEELAAIHIEGDRLPEHLVNMIGNRNIFHVAALYCWPSFRRYSPVLLQSRWAKKQLY